jgi:hypothetical protein
LIFAQFTGNVEVDFPVTQDKNGKNFATRKYEIQTITDGLDVGVPPAFSAMNMSVSGWDIKDMRFQYDYANDALHIGINCFGVCGDADGDGDAGRSSAILLSSGGTDLASFSGSESCAMAIDIGKAGDGVPDNSFDFIIGYPADSQGSTELFPCERGTPLTTAGFDTGCFGIYRYLKTTGAEQIGQRFVFLQNDPLLQQAITEKWAIDHTTENGKPGTDTARPDLEWTISKFNSLRQADGVPPVDTTGVQEFRLHVSAFCGSFQDDGVGEDSFPNSSPFAVIIFPCQVFDACDVCGGNGSTCRDCAGVPNGPAVYDRCDVCAGNGQSCLDCRGVPFGTTRYDVCDVCAGNGQSCLDCRGTPFGTTRYDVCNVCGGNGQSCLDCRGVPNGSSRYDVCNVCDGNGTTCRDCQGVVAGTARYDVCNICNGDGLSCRDCNGVPFGTARYDVCNICNGNGLSCRDCRNTPFGTATYDRCDVCNGNGSSCLDCAGVPFGTSVYDFCDVCDGDGTSCLPKAVPFDLCARRSFDRCELFPGDQFRGFFADSDDKLANKAFTITVAQDGYVIIASEHSTTYSRFVTSADRTQVSIHDLASVPREDKCNDLTGIGLYDLVWGDDSCRILTLERGREPCNRRRRLFGDAIVLEKRPCRGPADAVCNIQERTVFTGKREDGSRSWFVFGGNDAYVETAIDADGDRTSYFGRFAVNDKDVSSSSSSSHSSSSSSSSSETSSSDIKTFSESMIAFTEFASDPVDRQCPLSVSTGFYHARGLDLSNDHPTEGTFEALHGVYERSHRIHRDGSSSTWEPLDHVDARSDGLLIETDVDDDDDDSISSPWHLERQHARRKPSAYAKNQRQATTTSSSSDSSTTEHEIDADETSSSLSSVDWAHFGSSSDSSSHSDSSDSSSSSDRKRGYKYIKHHKLQRAHKYDTVDSEYHGRSYRRAAAKNNCGIITIWSEKFDADPCEARLARLSTLTIVGIDSCRGGVPPECTCNPKDDSSSEACTSSSEFGTSSSSSSSSSSSRRRRRRTRRRAARRRRLAQVGDADSSSSSSSSSTSFKSVSVSSASSRRRPSRLTRSPR